MDRTNETKTAFFQAFLAAALYALSMPLSKRLLAGMEPTVLAGLLYLGAGGGVGVLRLVGKRERGLPLTRRETPWLCAMVALDIAAPILLLLGLSRTTAANASLLANFEIAATASFAALLFRERVSGRLWLAVGLVTAAAVLLTAGDADCLSFSGGSVYVLLACLCWGLENNCTRRIAAHNAFGIVAVKGLGAGLGALLIAAVLGEPLPPLPAAAAALGLGFLSYGLSIVCYLRAQRRLGAARTSACYAAAPFLGAGLSLLLLREPLSPGFFPGLLLMAAGAALTAADGLRAQKRRPG